MKPYLWLAPVLALVLAWMPACADLAHYESAETACETGAWEACERDMTRALEAEGLTYDEEARALYQRGRARVHQRRYAEALEDLERSLDLDRGDAEAFAYRGVARARTRHYAGALEDFNYALEGVLAAETRRLVVFQRGVLYSEVREYRGAVRDLSYVLAAGTLPPPARYTALVARGKSYLRLGQTETALADLDRAVQLAPEQAAAYKVRSLAWRARGDRAREVEDLRTASRLDGTTPLLR